jgi:hypothetical protein
MPKPTSARQVIILALLKDPNADTANSSAAKAPSPSPAWSPTAHV